MHCSICDQPRPADQNKIIADKPVCDDCYYTEISNVLEEHPPRQPERSLKNAVAIARGSDKPPIQRTTI